MVSNGTELAFNVHRDHHLSLWPVRDGEGLEKK